MKPGPEELRAMFKRSVIVLAGFGSIHCALFCLLDKVGLNGRKKSDLPPIVGTEAHHTHPAASLRALWPLFDASAGATNAAVTAARKRVGCRYMSDLS